MFDITKNRQDILSCAHFYTTMTIELNKGVIDYDTEKQIYFNNRERHPIRCSNIVSGVLDIKGPLSEVLFIPEFTSDDSKFILIKSKNNPNLFSMAHLHHKKKKDTQDNKDYNQMYERESTAYGDLLQSFESNEELDVIFCGRLDKASVNDLMRAALAKNCQITSFREIPFNFKTKKPDIVEYALEKAYLCYIPDSDDFLIHKTYYRMYHPASSKKYIEIYHASNVFSDERIVFNLLDGVVNKEITEAVFNSSGGFKAYLPAFTKAFKTASHREEESRQPSALINGSFFPRHLDDPLLKRQLVPNFSEGKIISSSLP